MNSTDTATATSTTDTTTYTQAELESRVQAERLRMAHDVASRALNPITTFAKLLITGLETESEWATLSTLGDLLELATMGAQLQVMRIAMKESVGYDALPPYSYSLSDTITVWEHLRREAKADR